MGLNAIRNLQDEWFGSAKSPTEFARLLDEAFDLVGFTEQFVSSALAAAHATADRTKVVKDNVWGMIELDESSIRLLDCPIVQRLRRVKQLGFSYITYPSAEHSRFVHSLGMFGVVARFIESANKGGRTHPGEVQDFQAHHVTPSERWDLLHASLLHDSGHLPFSHASEFAFEALPTTEVGGVPLEEFFYPAEREMRIRKAHLAELLSVAMVLSRRFGKFYRGYVRATDTPESAEDATLRVASLIMGQPTGSGDVGFAELISGRVIDADKLDYVSRDGLACGIPTGIDVDRLFLRSSFFRVAKGQLNKLRERAGNPLVDSDQVHFIVNASGRDTIEEVISARTSLYHRVYFHQTTRNSERLYEKLVEEVSKSAEERALIDCLKVWAKSDEELLAMFKDSKVGTARELAFRLFSRDLPKRAVVFGQGELQMMFPVRTVFRSGYFGFEEGQVKLPPLQHFAKRQLFGPKLSQLEEEIAAECVKLARLIGDDLEEQGGPPLNGKPLILVSPVQVSPAVHDVCLVLQNRELVYSRDLHNVSQTNDAEEIFQASGYILTDDPWREIAFFAARKLLYENTRKWVQVEARVEEPSPEGRAPEQERVGLRAQNAPEIFTLPALSALNLSHDQVLRRTGISRARIERIQHFASSRGYLDSCPFLSSKPEIDWSALSNKFSKFEGQFGWHISRELVEAFIWQAPPRWRRHLTDLVGEIEVLDRSSTAKMIERSLQSLRTAVRMRVRLAPLSPNSGQEVRIALEEQFRGNEEFKRAFEIFHSLEELLQTRPGEEFVIALVDDNVISASQAFAQLACWVGVPRFTWPEELRAETNVDEAPLSNDAKQAFLQKLARKQIAICVALGAPAKAETNLKTFSALVQAQSSDVQSDSQNLFETDTFAIPLYASRDLTASQPRALRDGQFAKFIREVGAQVFATAKYGKEYGELAAPDRAVCDKNALGYDNGGGLSFTFRNVPVSTLTALWCPGKYEGRPWVPLGLRRGYAKKLLIG